MTSTERAMCTEAEDRIRELEANTDGWRQALSEHKAALDATEQALRDAQAENVRLLGNWSEADALWIAAKAEVTRLRNSMGDVRGMQSDGATPEDMDHALYRALCGGIPRADFDAARSRGANDEIDRPREET